ncbi:MAG TPA: hypothetical protein VH479_23890 [Acidimicrobiales bacterium]
MTPGGPAVDLERRAALNAAKLAALVNAHWGPGERTRHKLGAGAALIDPESSPARAWVLADGPGDRSLGPALVWAERLSAAEVHLVADPEPAGALARQAALFADPAPTVWAVDGTSLVPATAAPVPPRAEAPSPPELVDLLIDAGVEIVVEGGVLRGEVNGLEVARIVAGETTAGVPLDAPLLEVGVGKADRELTAMVHGAMTPVEQLTRVVDIVRRQRRPGAPRHPLNQLVPDRWLRAVLCRNPALVGLASLRPAEGPRPRQNLTERDIATAVGDTAAGDSAVVACTVGISVDLVPAAADARAALDPDARLILAVPARDDHPGTRRLAARLRDPAEVVAIPGDWKAAG